MKKVFLIKVSKRGVSQPLGGYPNKDALRENANRIEKVLKEKYPQYGVKREYCQYNENFGNTNGYLFTLI